MALSKEVKVGLLSVVSLTVFYLGFKFLTGVELFSSSRVYYAVYDNIDGLQVSNPVIINGLNVGRVSGIEILQDQNNRLKVGLEVNEEIKVTKNSKALLTDNGLLGGKSIELKLAPGDSYLEVGDYLIAEKPKGFVGVMKEKSMPVLENVDSLLANFNELASKINGMSGKIEGTLTNLESSTGQLDQLLRQNSATLHRNLLKFDSISSTLLVTSRQLPPLMEKLNTVADSVSTMEVKALVRNTNHLMVEMKQTVKAINKAEGSLGLLIKDDSLYRNMNRTMQDLDSLFIDMKTNPKRYINISVF
ncbi:MlaD family protein [Rapidithrix thailandica]|uniref:MlaD family protein n=1 Tax=Rapidithrix thailandica TaxID=413964 RepID=A0AAW9SCZ4_9BACT